MKSAKKANQDLIISLYIKGCHTVKEIAAMEGTSKQNVYLIIKKHGIEKRTDERTRKKEIQVEITRNLYLYENLTPEQIAQQTGRSTEWVKNTLEDLGLIIQIRKKPRLKISARELADLYINQNLSAQKIADLYGIEKSCVYGKLLKSDIKKGSRNALKLSKEELKDMFINQDMSAREIAEHFKVNVTLINSRIFKHQIKKKAKEPCVSLAEVERLSALGLSQHAIAETLGVSQSSVSIAARKNASSNDK